MTVVEHYEHKLTKWLKTAENLVVLGIGNTLRGDDGVGPWISSKLEKFNSSRFTSITANMAPENYIGVIKRLKPTHLLIIDAAVIPSYHKVRSSSQNIEQSQPGSWCLVDPARVYELFISTHSGTMGLVLKAIKKKIPGIDVKFLVVQPCSTIIDEKLSPTVAETAKYLLNIILSHSINI
ncbi:MAG: hypothetical protein ACTSYO_07120 [Candidatus Ranarchaeia archaeon]